MKKLVLMLSAALISMAAQATIYVTGGGVTGAPSSWNPANPLVVEAADGVYTFQATGEFKISTTQGDWNAFNGGAKMLNGDWAKATTTATANLKSGSENITTPMDGVEITYEVASDLSTIKATLPEGKSFGDPVTHTYALHGQITGNSSWESTDLTENNGVWEWTGTVVAGAFGIKELTNGSQTAWISADGTTDVDAAGEYAAKYNGTNWSSTLAGEYTFSFNPETMKLTITGQGTDPDPDPDPVVVTYALHGQLVSGSWKTTAMTENNGAWEWTGTVVAGEFGIKKLENGEQTGWISADGTTTVDAAGEYAAKYDGSNWVSSLAGEYTFSFNPTTMKLTITGQGTDPDPDPTVRYALHGTITGDASWASVELTANSGKYEWTGAVVAGDFGIKVMDATGNQTAWINAASADEKAISAEGTYNTSASGAGNWSSTLEGNYTFSFDPTANTLTITKYEGEIQVVKSYAFKGTITNGESTEWVSTAMTEGEDGTWSWSGTVDTGDFGIQYLENGVQKTWYASADESNAIAAAGEYNAKVNGKNWALSLTGEVTLTFNPTTLVLTVAGGTVVDPDPTVETPENVYLVGNFENDWSTSDPVTMEKDGNIFTVKTSLKAASSSSTDGYFSFITVKGADWDTVNTGDRYGASTDDEEITIATNVPYTEYKAGVDAKAAKSWKLKAGTYLFTIDFESKTVRVDPSDAVENIELTEEAEAEYYNLQGVKVANPSNGVYIRIINGKATKVVK
ncbi:MAG: hypothetical protein ACI4AK_05670 [Lepagella sp.]